MSKALLNQLPKSCTITILEGGVLEFEVKNTIDFEILGNWIKEFCVLRDNTISINQEIHRAINLSSKIGYKNNTFHLLDFALRQIN